MESITNLPYFTTNRKLLMELSCLLVRKALKLLGLTNKLYQKWSIIVRGYCTASQSFLCVKRYPHQLQKKEVQQMKKLLTTPMYAHWPIVSIAAKGLRTGSIVASTYSWYKYARLMELTHKNNRKPKRQVGLLAEKPNEYLHVDTTYYPITNDQKVCITFVMNNYSKMILGFQVAEKLSFQVVKDALVKALKTITCHPDQQPVYLVADGGSENHNQHIDDFIAGLSGCKIEAYVGGKSIDNKNGKFNDFLIKNSLSDNVSFLELKTHKTPLLESSPYRGEDVFSATKDLTGCISQVLNQRDNFQKEFDHLKRKSKKNFETFNSKCVVLIGSLKALTLEQKYSFELFRSNSRDVEIITFDELQTKIESLQKIMLSN